MPSPSYFFTLFKKFQVLNHVPGGSVHGAGSPTGGFDLKDAATAIGSSDTGALLGATTNPADSPLWAVLNSRAAGNPGFTPVNVGGINWPTMPPGSPLAWTNFQVSAPAPKLVQVFGDWIAAGKVSDIPTGVLGTVPGPIAGPLDPGVELFVCSVAGDDGTRPGTVPADFWASSLIFLVDPATGSTVNPPELAAASEYFVAAVIGNRGSAGSGAYLAPTAGPATQSAAWVMVWNSGASPAVQLPALSNLDLNSTNGVYEVYFVRSGRYEVVGFRLNVQTAFDGLVAAVAASSMDLGGLTPEQWVKAEGAHLCVRVLVREAADSWPTLGSTPFTDRRFGQKNLAPFAIDLAVVDTDPDIIWKNFVVGDVIQRLLGGGDERWGAHKIDIDGDLADGITALFLAVPRRSFKRWFRQGAFEGFQVVEDAQALKPPFPEHVILAVPEGRRSFALPALGEEYLGLSLGIQYSGKRLKPGRLGEIQVVQRTTVPKVDRERQCYELEQVIVGGFTLRLEAHDSREVPKRSGGLPSGYLPSGQPTLPTEAGAED